MPSSVIRPFPLEKQRKENLAHFFVGRLRAELGHGKRIGRFRKLIDFIVVGKVKANFHLVHRHSANVTQSALPIPEQARVDAHHMFVVRIGKGFISQVNSLIKECLGLMFRHERIIGKGGIYGHSYFPKVEMPASSLFFAQRGQSIVGKCFECRCRPLEQKQCFARTKTTIGPAIRPSL